jgi:hypothetical protein
MRWQMRRLIMLGALAFGACGLESVLDNAGHQAYERPASKITGTLPSGLDVSKVTVLDGDGNAITPFLTAGAPGTYELRLPSSKYSMLRIAVQSANMQLRAIVPAIGEESAVTGITLDARSVTETLIVEARLSMDGASLKTVTPDAYLGTQKLIRAAFDQPGPTQDLLNMVQRIVDKYDATLAVTDPSFFIIPEYKSVNGTVTLKTSALDRSFLPANPFDYVGDGRVHKDSDAFDTQLTQVAQLYRPAGCPDPDHIRLVFTVDFNDSAKNGNCGAISKFTWAKDKPGKRMFFVGWIYDGSAGQTASDIQDVTLAKAMGSSTPNVVPMYDDGTNGDQTAGDNIWTITFDAPRSSPGHVLRIGYKYTWGKSGDLWTGTEEWPGNSRILEVVDDNGDDFVYRHDVFSDEATNKDKANLSSHGTGTLTWTTDLHGCGTPETHENKYDNNSCKCGSVLTPKWIGPLTVTCTQ